MRLLWLEDEEMFVRSAEKILTNDLGIDSARIEVVSRSKFAMERLRAEARSEDPFTHALLDLQLHEDSVSAHQGFEVLRFIRLNNLDITAVILSSFTDDDEARAIKKRLRDIGVEADEVINKRHRDLLPELLRSQLVSVARELEELEPMMYARSLRMENLIRQLKVYLEQAVPIDEDEILPSILIGGDYGSGKSSLVDALPIIAGSRNVDGRQVQRLNRRLVTQNAAISAASGEGYRIDMMGTREFQNVPDARGLFERATLYRGRENKFATSDSIPVRDSVGIAFLDEVHALHRTGRDLSEPLISVIDRQSVMTAGIATDIKIACLFVTATSIALEELKNIESAKPFYQRFKVFHVPAAWEQGEDWLEILRWLVRKKSVCEIDEVSWDRDVEDRIRDNVFNKYFNIRQLTKIAAQTLEKVPIVTEAMVIAVEKETRAEQRPRGSGSDSRVTVSPPGNPVPTAPEGLGERRLHIDASGSSSSLAEDMLASLNRLPPERHIAFKSWLTCCPEAFSPETVSFREENHRRWADACLLIAFELGAKGFLEHFEVEKKKDGTPRRDWRWRDVLNPCVNGRSGRGSSSLSKYFGGYPNNKGPRSPKVKGILGFEYVKRQLHEMSNRKLDTPAAEDERAVFNLACRLFSDQ